MRWLGERESKGRERKTNDLLLWSCVEHFSYNLGKWVAKVNHVGKWHGQVAQGLHKKTKEQIVACKWMEEERE